MEIEEKLIFPNYIYTTKLNDIDNKKILEEIENSSNIFFSKVDGEIGGSFSNILGLESGINSLDNLSKIILSIVQEINKIWAVSNNIKLDNLWININKNKEFNMPHVHPKSLFSATYYLSANPNQGSLVFERPDLLQHYYTENINYQDYLFYKIKPESGLLCVFPSYIYHHVEPNFTKHDRISIAFNFS